MNREDEEFIETEQNEAYASVGTVKEYLSRREFEVTKSTTYHQYQHKGGQRYI